MECYASGIESRDTGWRGDNHPLCRVSLKIVEKGSLTGAGFTCQENIATSVLDEVACELQFIVCESHIRKIPHSTAFP